MPRRPTPRSTGKPSAWNTACKRVLPRVRWTFEQVRDYEEGVRGLQAQETERRAVGAGTADMDPYVTGGQLARLHIPAEIRSDAAPAVRSGPA